MQRLGGGIVSMASAESSSAAKGESVADTARTVSQYADVIVIRHPRIGSAQEAADAAAEQEQPDAHPAFEPAEQTKTGGGVGGPDHF